MSTAAQTFAVPRSGIALLLRDYAELIKARITTLIVLTAWAGFYFGAAKTGVSSLSWTLLHALFGIGLVSGGTAALNEVIERDIDSLMHRTSMRPLVTRRMSMAHGLAVGLSMVLGGSAYLAIACNPLTGALTLLTSVVYLGAYTPLKQVHPLCTFVGAFPGAMPPLLGWTAARAHIESEALVLFAVVFCWQFPHFHSIAWLYREDYERAGIRMLPVVKPAARSTAREIVMYLAALLAVTLVPVWFHMGGRLYLDIAVVLGVAFFWTGWRLWASRLEPRDARSKPLARQVLLASVLYLPILFAAMMISAL